MTLPPLGPVQPTPATPEGFAVAVGRARQRRWQQIGTAACVAVLVVASAGLLRDSATATDSLTSAPNDVPHRPAPAAPAPPEPAAFTSAPRQPVATGSHDVRPSGNGRNPVATVTRRPPRVEVTPQRGPQTDVVFGDVDRLNGPEECRVPAGDWCGGVVARRQASWLQFTITLCPPASADAEPLSFESSHEVDVVVGTDDGRRVWRWSDGRTFEERTFSRQAEPGTCLTWDVWWETPVAGDYVVQATVRAAEVAGLDLTTSATY